MKNKRNIIAVVVVVVAIGLGFIGGMEYKSYQIRSAIGDLASGFSDAFKGIGDTDKIETSKPSAKVANDLDGKVTLEVTKKGFTTESYQDYNTFTFKLTNKTGKDIEGVQGIINFMDIFGDMIKKVSVSYDKNIKAGESNLYLAAVDYNKFMDQDTKLRQIDLSKLKYEWNIKTIVYTDGTSESI